MNIFEKVKFQWEAENLIVTPANMEKISALRGKLNIPEGLARYFSVLNGTGGEYDNELFQFYAINEFLPLTIELRGTLGKVIFNTLPNPELYYAFGNYFLHTVTFAIKLQDKTSKEKYDILAICGDEYKIVATNITEFFHFYLTDQEKLMV